MGDLADTYKPLAWNKHISVSWKPLHITVFGRLVWNIWLMFGFYHWAGPSGHGTQFIISLSKNRAGTKAWNLCISNQPRKENNGTTKL